MCPMARWSVTSKFARRGEQVSYDPRGRRYLVGEAEHRRARETPLDERPFQLNTVERSDGRTVRVGDRVHVGGTGPYEVAALTGWPGKGSRRDRVEADLTFRGRGPRVSRADVESLVYEREAGYR